MTRKHILSRMGEEGPGHTCAIEDEPSRNGYVRCGDDAVCQLYGMWVCQRHLDQITADELKAEKMCPVCGGPWWNHKPTCTRVHWNESWIPGRLVHE
jgi:hypothetical protein